MFVALAAAVLAAASAGCGGATIRRFPLRDPLWVDPDLTPTSVPCRTESDEDGKPQKVCRPAEYESPLAWDLADNLLFRNLSEYASLEQAGEALNVNSLDEVPDSSWFTNRIGRKGFSPQDVARGACEGTVLDPDAQDVTWLIDSGKPNGANPGFRVRSPDKTKFMLKADLVEGPERATGAAAVATRLYYAAGWYTSCDSVVYFPRSRVKLKPGLTYTDNSTVTRPFDQAALDKVLANASHRGELVRMSASRWLPGRTVGPFRYIGVKEDDPNDRVPHERRRDLRGARLMAAWLNHYDSREQNSMDSWIASNPKDKEGSPGFMRHYYIDLGDCFGSDWDWVPMAKRLGHSYYFDFADVGYDFITLGLDERPWDEAYVHPRGTTFPYFLPGNFTPEQWKGNYPNPAFQSMREGDAAWFARILARFTPEHIEAAVRAGDFSNPVHTAYLIETLLARQQLILRRYFAKLSPLADVRVRGTELCATDLARRSNAFDARSFRYRASVSHGDPPGRSAAASPRPAPGGDVCLNLEHRAPDGGPADDAAERYVVVELSNGQAENPLLAHLYDLGPAKGFRLVGVERPDLVQLDGSRGLSTPGPKSCLARPLAPAMRVFSRPLSKAGPLFALALASAFALPAFALTQPGREDPLPILRGLTCQGGNVQTCVDELGDPIRVRQVAAVTPETFDPSCNLSFEIIARGAAFRSVFGWYNVRDDGQKPAPADLHSFLLCDEPPGTKKALSIRDTPEYKGGQPGFSSGRIGFFIATPEDPAHPGTMLAGNCPTFDAGGPVTGTYGHVYYSERHFNPDQHGDDSYIHLVILQSEKSFPGFYFGWEDQYGGGDDDFNDILTLVTGITCAGGGQPCEVPGGEGVCSSGLTQCRSGALECVSMTPSSAEACDGLDNDCDGSVDEGDICPAGSLCVRGACAPNCHSNEFPCAAGKRCVGEGVCVDTECADVACGAGEVCNAGRCRAPCDDVVCPLGQECRLGACVDACEAAAPSCDAGYVCSRGVCVERCDVCTVSGTGLCRNGQACDSSSGLCVDDGCDGLSCAEGQVCQAGQCVDACANAACPGDQICTLGRCVSVAAAGQAGSGGSLGIAGAPLYNWQGSGGVAGASGASGGSAGAPVAEGSFVADGGDGCGCEVAGSRRGDAGVVALAALAALGAGRGRRRRQAG